MPIGRMQLPRELRSSGGIMSIGDQGGMKNYLGNQPMVTAPKFWRSGPDSPPTELAYITDAEKDMIMKADLHGSLSQGPNEGPSGIISLDSQGDYTRDRSPAGTAGRSRQGQAQHEQHMKGILTGQKNIGQTVQTGPKTRKYAVPEYVNVKQPDGTYKNKYIGSGYKSYGQPSFFGNLFSRGAPGYRGIKGMPAFFGKPKFETRGTPGGPNFGYYSDYEKFGETRDAIPSFGILGILKGLANKFKKPRDMSEYNKLSLTAPEDQKVYIPEGMDPSMIINNPFKNQDFNYGITNNPLTQTLMTKNYSPKPKISNLKERINISNQFQMPLDYSASDLQARARRAMTQPGMQVELAPYEKGIPEELQFWDGRPFTATPYDPYKEMYSTLPGNDLRTELTKTQKKGLDAKKGNVMSGIFSVEDAYESIKPFDNPKDPSTLEEVKQYYGIV